MPKVTLSGLYAAKEKKLFLGQDAIKTTNTTKEEEVEAGKGDIDV